MIHLATDTASCERAGWENTARFRNQSDRRICRIPPAHEQKKNNLWYCFKYLIFSNNTKHRKPISKFDWISLIELLKRSELLTIACEVWISFSQILIKKLLYQNYLHHIANFWVTAEKISYQKKSFLTTPNIKNKFRRSIKTNSWFQLTLATHFAKFVAKLETLLQSCLIHVCCEFVNQIANFDTKYPTSVQKKKKIPNL